MPKGPAELILSALESFGPMTAQELHRSHMPHLPRDQVSSTLVRLRKQPAGPRSAPKRVFISAWERDAGIEGTRFYPRAVYSAGSAPDAPKPTPLTQTQYNKRRHQKKMERRSRPNSVFDLARVVRIRRVTKPANRPAIKERA